MFYIATKENSDLAPADEMVRIFHYKKKEYMLIIYWAVLDNGLCSTFSHD